MLTSPEIQFSGVLLDQEDCKVCHTVFYLDGSPPFVQNLELPIEAFEISS